MATIASVVHQIAREYVHPNLGIHDAVPRASLDKIKANVEQIMSDLEITPTEALYDVHVDWIMDTYAREITTTLPRPTLADVSSSGTANLH